jgi:6-phosphogluconolactonase
MDKLKPEVFVFLKSGDMDDYLLRQWREIAKESIAVKGFFTAALSGGSSPADFYNALAGTKDSFPWNKTHLFLVDERFVPTSDRDSNYRLMTNLFLRKIGIAVQNIHAIDTDAPSCSAAAGRYEIELRNFFGISDNGIPRFDLVLLGMGEDGHTASLFPGGSELMEKSLLAVSVSHSDIKHERISLSLPALNNARNVIFIAKGNRKAAVLRRVILDRDKSLPAANIIPAQGRQMFVLDSEAASGIYVTDDKGGHNNNSLNDILDKED